MQQGLIDLDEAADALEAQAKEIAELKVNNHALKDVVSFEKKRSADYKSLCDQLATAAEPFTSPDIVDETDGTIPLMDKLEEALTAWRAMK